MNLIYKTSSIVLIFMILFSSDVLSQKFILLQKGSNEKNRLKYKIRETMNKSKKQKSSNGGNQWV